MRVATSQAFNFGHAKNKASYISFPRVILHIFFLFCSFMVVWGFGGGS